MTKIYLTKDQVALVDDSDYAWLTQWRWYAHYSSYTRSYYAVTNVTIGFKQKAVYMSRLILGLTDPKIQVDHVNENTLDNQRVNLRPATTSQNQANRGKQRNTMSGFKGVCWHKKEQKWRAQITFRGKKLWLGSFTTREAAYEAYKVKALELFGEFARLD